LRILEYSVEENVSSKKQEVLSWRKLPNEELHSISLGSVAEHSY
jgi:hypothetical protein